ncbi:MAG: methylated-DNA--[protein]-cysteine S-methyltransferase [Rhodobacteraceae bacterium]|nr:MAG: methylated-DNA--[protein]-cysteine S-methyltransferase [Paracoccaceae bacterium]
MARALRHLAERREEQPSLEAVAAHLGVAPEQFRRAFGRWVGVSPKRYLQHLTLADARAMLAERASVLDATYAAGLSSPGRLHDLFVRWEAMSPGEWARRGAGLDVAFGWFDTPFGPALAMGTARGLCGLGFAAEIGEGGCVADMRARWPEARFIEAPERLRAWVEAAFGGGACPVAPVGGPFQIKVWEALLAIPPGAVATYAAIAERIGAPKAVRAVGTAVGRNPVAWLIPCHRAIRRDGGLGGYHWGLGVKRAMLAWESARREAAEG